jgi:hypothetical protein
VRHRGAPECQRMVEFGSILDESSRPLLEIGDNEPKSNEWWHPAARSTTSTIPRQSFSSAAA